VAFVSLTLTPALIFYLMAQKHIIAGLTAGAVKDKKASVGKSESFAEKAAFSTEKLNRIQHTKGVSKCMT